MDEKYIHLNTCYWDELYKERYVFLWKHMVESGAGLMYLFQEKVPWKIVSYLRFETRVGIWKKASVGGVYSRTWNWAGKLVWMKNS